MTASNAMMSISPCWSAGTWVFDDPSVGLVREPFVMGAPAMIDYVVELAGISEPDARSEGISLLFSASPCPGFHKEALLVRPDMGGNWYRYEEPDMKKVSLRPACLQAADSNPRWTSEYSLRHS